MPKIDETSTNSKKKKAKKLPPRSPEALEQRMINLSMRQAEQMLEEGRAPAQIVVHFLKLATEKTKYENEKLKADAEMSRTKSQVLRSQEHSEELYEKAMEAFKSYGGNVVNYSEDNRGDDYYD